MLQDWRKLDYTKLMRNSIILAGIKHSGKSTLGKLLASRLHFAFYDTDDVITERTGKTPRELYRAGGEAAFCTVELDACRQLANSNATSGERAVIATGGGICNNLPALSLLRPIGKIVYLDVSEDTVLARILRQSELPAYITAKNPQTPDDVRCIFHRIYTERVQRYLSFADIVFTPQNVSAEENADGLNMLTLV
jgi:shikimate kinase